MTAYSAYGKLRGANQQLEKSALEKVTGAFMNSVQIVDVNADNVDRTTFFCMQSKPENPGYQRKRKWLDKRFSEGLRIRMLGQRDKRRWSGERGFIEYIPGEYAWRGVEASDYMFIHCLWVVGRSRGKGGARRLLDVCLKDAKDAGFAGVATVTAENGFAAGRAFFEHLGFEAVAECDPKIALMARPFKKRAELPAFSSGALRGPRHYKSGLTIFRSDQCPYIDDATRIIREQAEKHGIAPIRVIELKSADAIRKRSPTPYGVFATVLEGGLLSYRYLTPQEFKKAIDKTKARKRTP